MQVLFEAYAADVISKHSICHSRRGTGALYCFLKVTARNRKFFVRLQRKTKIYAKRNLLLNAFRSSVQHRHINVDAMCSRRFIRDA